MRFRLDAITQIEVYNWHKKCEEMEHPITEYNKVVVAKKLTEIDTKLKGLSEKL